MVSSIYIRGGGGLVIRCRPQSRGFPGLKLHSTEYPSLIGPASSYIIRKGSNVLPKVWYGNMEWASSSGCRSRHLITVQNYEVRPKIALILL
ncbi:hypothetical protein AVEN_205053-1 [Araneus ventricosus]|uniref:Uncharacterized protein n=1 Tax=Araneus ventricosus TaxID=182803 RepID=A0A4Y2ISM3_ARAVE|nr:hypothetical protein AVEN_205053-1 [Araneus ventricosus]